MKRYFFFALIMMAFSVGLYYFLSQDIQSVSRIALVIGNGEYENVQGSSQFVHNAKDITYALEKLDFKVIFQPNATFSQLNQNIRQFRNQSKKSELAIVYYTGYAAQWQNRNYLLATDTDLSSHKDVATQGFEISKILEVLAQNNATNLLILDASQISPYHKQLPDLKLGLAEMESPRNTLIAYAAKPNTPAQTHSEQRNTIYTRYLFNNLQQYADKKIIDLFIKTRQQVANNTTSLTQQYQIPWESHSLLNNFCFKSCQGNAIAKIKTVELNNLLFLWAGWETAAQKGSPIQWETIRADDVGRTKWKDFGYAFYRTGQVYTAPIE
ncbi:MAG: caspase family protein, partial [Thiotrichaceae bacterium]|nr:caspase family protein [Thiotrichaceae bacterium]